MYFIKTKGTAKIPDYVQIRGNNFALIEHITLNKINDFINNSDFNDKQKIKDMLADAPFGKIIKID
jgi:hypothetical protein